MTLSRNLDQALDQDVALFVQIWADAYTPDVFVAQLLELQADDEPSELALAKGKTMHEALKNLQAQWTAQHPAFQ